VGWFKKLKRKITLKGALKAGAAMGVPGTGLALRASQALKSVGINPKIRRPQGRSTQALVAKTIRRPELVQTPTSEKMPLIGTTPSVQEAGGMGWGPQTRKDRKYAESGKRTAPKAKRAANAQAQKVAALAAKWRAAGKPGKFFDYLKANR